MRRAAPTDFLVSHFGWWRAAIVAAAAVAALALAAWVWQRRTDGLTWPAGLLGTAAVVGALSAARRQRPIRLRWDGVHWYADVPDAEQDDASAAPRQLAVVVDLGPWMLLRLRSIVAAPAARTVWVALQRRGHEAQWHGMRRAVYFPRPSVGGRSVAEPHLPE